MGSIIPFPTREDRHRPGVLAPCIDMHALLPQLQASAADIAAALETCVQVTAYFQRYEISSAQCARAAAHLQHLHQLVQALSRLVEPLASIPAQRYPVLIQAHHVATLLEQAIRAVQEARVQRGNLCRYLGAWREAQRLVQTFPAPVTELVAAISFYCQAIMSHAQHETPERTCI